jgi:hypothetical protein
MILVLAETVVEWSAGFETFCGRFADRFPRMESRRQIRPYVRGLRGELERKNGWTWGRPLVMRARSGCSDY